jgi:Homeodomain-like domain
MGKIKLDEREVAQLEIVLKTTDDVRQLQRAQALLWLSEGDSASEVAERLRVDRRTVYNWASRFEQRADGEFEARLADGIRSGRPVMAKGIIDPLIDLEAVINFSALLSAGCRTHSPLDDCDKLDLWNEKLIPAM